MSCRSDLSAILAMVQLNLSVTVTGTNIKVLLMAYKIHFISRLIRYIG